MSADPFVPACRLEQNFSWDSLLSSVGLLCFRFKLARGPWSVDLEAAAARLAGSSMDTELDEKGYTSVTIPASWRPAGERGFFEIRQCRAQCGACSACLEAEQVLSQKPAIMPEFCHLLDAWRMPLWISAMGF